METIRDVADFEHRAEVAYAAMRKAEGQLAVFCYDDTRFYLGRAMEIARAAGRKDMVVRLRLRRGQITSAFFKQQDRIATCRQRARASIESWENEGGAVVAV
jgi:hypothetical protein